MPIVWKENPQTHIPDCVRFQIAIHWFIHKQTEINSPIFQPRKDQIVGKSRALIR